MSVIDDSMKLSVTICVIFDSPVDYPAQEWSVLTIVSLLLEY